MLMESQSGCLVLQAQQETNADMMYKKFASAFHHPFLELL